MCDLSDEFVTTLRNKSKYFVTLNPYKLPKKQQFLGKLIIHIQYLTKTQFMLRSLLVIKIIKIIKIYGFVAHISAMAFMKME